MNLSSFKIVIASHDKYFYLAQRMFCLCQNKDYQSI